MSNYHLDPSKISHSQENQINDIIRGRVADTFVIALMICFISIFAGFVLAVFVVRMLIDKNIF